MFKNQRIKSLEERVKTLEAERIVFEAEVTQALSLRLDKWFKEQDERDENFRQSVLNHNLLIEKIAQGIHDNLKALNERVK